MKRAAPPVIPLGLDNEQGAAFLGVGVSSWYRLRRDPSFPPAREIAPGLFRWVASELAEWLISRPAVAPRAEPAQLRSRRYRDGKPVEGRAKRQAVAAE